MKPDYPEISMHQHVPGKIDLIKATIAATGDPRAPLAFADLHDSINRTAKILAPLTTKAEVTVINERLLAQFEDADRAPPLDPAFLIALLSMIDAGLQLFICNETLKLMKEPQQ